LGSECRSLSTRLPAVNPALPRIAAVMVEAWVSKGRSLWRQSGSGSAGVVEIAGGQSLWIAISSAITITGPRYVHERSTGFSPGKKQRRRRHRPACMCRDADGQSLLLPQPLEKPHVDEMCFPEEAASYSQQRRIYLTATAALLMADSFSDDTVYFGPETLLH